MLSALEQHRKECREMQMAGMIWWLILWYASDEGTLEIPSEQQWLLCELVAALIEEVEGRKFYYSWRHDRTNREQVQEWDEWPSNLNAQLEKCRAVNPHAFSDTSPEGRLRELLKRFVWYKFNSDHDEKDWLSELRSFHESNTPRQSGRSRFTPNREMVAASIRFLGDQGIEIYATAMNWGLRIGTIMRPYVERDVAFIKKHYSW